MRVTVGMSGGVDSSVAALLLKRASHSVRGLFMLNWEDDDAGADGESGCHADADRKDALAVCARVGIPFGSVNFAPQYRARVFRHFLDEYRVGRTPNPDVLCNREIKFGTFLAAARAQGASMIATGHYVRSTVERGRFKLLRARDAAKDQSYFLHTLDQEQLAAAVFPLGDLYKTEVRRIAREAALPVADKRDSTGICFIGERDFRTFLSAYLPTQAGEVRGTDGRVLGEHRGALLYTTGQRSGLAIGGRAGGSGEAWYVVGKDVARNVVYVDQGRDSPWLMSRALNAGSAHWIDAAPPSAVFECTAMTRYRQPPQACQVSVEGDVCRVRFDAPQCGVAPGQSVVFYRGEECLGGAVIDATDARAIGAAA